MKFQKKPDYILLTTLVLLNLIGLISLAGASSAKSLQLTGKPTHFLFHQILYGLLPGIILGFVFYKIDLNFVKKMSFWFFLFAIFLTLLVFVPKIGIALFGSRRWIRIFGFTFQPSELLKLGFLIYLSSWLAKYKDQEHKIKNLLIPFLVILAILSLIFIFQPDISTLVIFGILGSILYFCAKTPISHIVILGGIGAVALLILIFLAPYRLNRLLVFLNPEMDPLGKGYHIKQSLIAVGSGGLFGKGLGLGVQKLGFLPHPMTDSIFAVLGEEIGFLGLFTIICLFLIFAWRGFRVAKTQKDEFKKLLSVGITSWITIQAFINMGAMIGVLPLTGIPLPFLSYGGSALFCGLMAIGLLLNITKK
ncbi:MAG: putative lipid II flippase FtsW [Candidatus Pacebacteria bacterium]|nr:putative lipid II flippase FtsW [Candidatus Paceibacterota bacterium]